MSWPGLAQFRATIQDTARALEEDGFPGPYSVRITPEHAVRLERELKDVCRYKSETRATCPVPLMRDERWVATVDGIEILTSTIDDMAAAHRREAR